MRILFLHGWHSVIGGVKPTFLKHAGHEVINPALNDDNFDSAIRTAQAKYDQHKPDVIVGSSRGGAVALNIESGETPLVLLCPAWKNWGTATRLKANSVILDARQDDVIPFSDSEELVANSGLPHETLIEVGRDHRLADSESLQAMLTLHTENDGLIEISHAERNFKWVSSRQKQLVRFLDGSHNTIFGANQKEYLDAVGSFVRSIQR